MTLPATPAPAGQAPAGTEGQAPTPTPAAPAAPVAPATPAQAAGEPAQPVTPAAPAAPQAGTQVTDVAALQKLLNAANAEAAANRTKLKVIEDKDKSEAQKLKEANETLSAQNRLYSVQMAAHKLGIVDPEAAAALLPADTPADQIELKLTEMLAARPWLKGTPAVNTPAGNPPKTGSGLTMDQIKTMTPDEINARWAEVDAVLRASGKAGITP